MLRLKHGGAYESDIRALRSSIRRNGTNLHCVDLPISGLNGSDRASLIVNMAYQPNASCGKADASLYTVAFTNAAGRMFRFKLNQPVTIPTASTDVVQLKEDGSYASLGHAHGPFPTLKKSNLHEAVSTLSVTTPSAWTSP